MLSPCQVHETKWSICDSRDAQAVGSRVWCRSRVHRGTILEIISISDCYCSLIMWPIGNLGIECWLIILDLDIAQAVELEHYGNTFVYIFFYEAIKNWIDFYHTNQLAVLALKTRIAHFMYASRQKPRLEAASRQRKCCLSLALTFWCLASISMLWHWSRLFLRYDIIILTFIHSPFVCL